MNLLHYTNITKKNVRDEANEFVTETVIDANPELDNDKTIVKVKSVKNLYAGDEVFLIDGEHDAKVKIFEVDSEVKTILVIGDHSEVANGGRVMKTDATLYIDEAIKTYSKFRPRRKVVKVNLNSNVMEVPEEWDAGFSYIEKILDASNNEMDFQNYFIDLNDSNVYSIFFKYSISQEIKVYYSLLHKMGNESIPEITIPDADVNAVCNIASAYYLLSLASRYGQSINNTVSADVTDYRERTNYYIKLSHEFLKKAAIWLNIDPEEIMKGRGYDEAISSNQEIDSQFGDANRIFNN